LNVPKWLCLNQYYPFGGFRTTPTAGLTDVGFTGHRHNNIGAGAENIGLIYMQARWYLPGVGRFASADVLVPDPTNPQQFNRYSYVLNNALRYTDPSGRYCYDPSAGAELMGTCINEDGTTYSLLGPSQPLTPLINFTAVNGYAWTAAEMAAVEAGAQQVARALWEASGRQLASPRSAFLEVYGGSVTFHKTGQSCTAATGATSCLAQVQTSRMVHVYTNIYDSNGNSRIPGPNTSDRWAVHELGHAFESRVNGRIGTWGHVRSQLPDNTLNRNGFASGFPGWQQSRENTRGEIFADMFVGWSYGQWETNPFTGALTNDAALKADFMTTNMSVWIDSATRP
jgi:RHS repeat-associated protein